MKQNIHNQQILEALHTVGPTGCTILALSKQFKVTKKVIKKCLAELRKPTMWYAWEDRVENKVYIVHWSYRKHIHPADLVEIKL